VLFGTNHVQNLPAKTTTMPTKPVVAAVDLQVGAEIAKDDIVTNWPAMLCRHRRCPIRQVIGRGSSCRWSRTSRS
jgi:hypothetical protein